MFRTWMIVAAFSHLVACFAIAVPPATVTLHGLLNEMTDYDAVARWPSPTYTAHQASSYDRARIAPNQPGWFANHDGSNYIRIEAHAGRQERVMLDADGPGAIVRFFLTTSGPRDGHLRVYIDDSDDPAIDWPTLDLMSGDLNIGEPLCLRHPEPLGHGGATFRLPILYAKHCKVTLEEADRVHAGDRYYHIDYRTYAAGTVVEPFTRATLDAARADIDRTNATLSNPPLPKTDQDVSIDATLEPGASKSIDLPPGPMAIRQLELSVAVGLPKAAREQALRSTIIRATFDDEPDSIWCPVGDFIGSGAGGFPVASWYRTVDRSGNAVSRWTMPYRKGGTITLQNLGNLSVPVKLTAKVGPWAWDDRSMYFHCNWHQEVRIPARPFRDWNFITTTGRGVMVGDVMSVFNPIPSWYGEGDEKIWIDGEAFPSQIGTGTEDYYDASWAPNPVFQTPFTNHPRMDEGRSQGQNVYTRSRNLDAVPFERSMQFDFEIETWKDSRVDYAGTTYWYGSPGARSNRQVEPGEARRPVPTRPLAMAIPNAKECESMEIAGRTVGLGVETQDMHEFNGTWSGNAQLLIRGTQVGDYIELAIPVEGTAPRRVTIYPTQANDYGILKFSVNGQVVDERFDGFATTPIPAGPITLGVFTPKDGRLVLRVELVGTNARSVGVHYLAGLDAVLLSE